jgi:hypothetical protein
MVTYEVTATGQKGYQVTAISPEWQGVVVGDFCSLQSAEEFAGRMREIDAGVHSIANKT